MIISMTVKDRPRELNAVMTSLRNAARKLEYTESILLIASVEPTEFAPLNVGIIKRSLHRNTFGYVGINSEVLGLQANTKKVLDAAWDAAVKLDQDFVLHLEDDLVLAPDALRLAVWLRDRYREDPAVGFVGLTRTGPLPKEKDWNRVMRSSWFDCHVWGTWRPMWERLSEDWPHEWYDHWAARVNELHMYRTSQVAPCLSRSASIGVYGEHCTPEYHERHNPDYDPLTIKIPPTDYEEAQL